MKNQKFDLKRAGNTQGRGLAKVDKGGPDGVQSLPENMHLKGVSVKGNINGNRHIVVSPGAQNYVGVEAKANPKVSQPKKGLAAVNRSAKPVRKK